jgi:hypothetical protein
MGEALLLLALDVTRGLLVAAVIYSFLRDRKEDTCSRSR